MVNEAHEEGTQYTREAIARTIAECYAAVQAVPSLKDAEFQIDTAKMIAKQYGDSALSYEGILGMYIPTDNSVHVLAGTVDPKLTQEFLHESGYSSTPSAGHALVHEDSHREHYANAARKTGRPRPPDHATDSQVFRWASQIQIAITAGLEAAARRDPDWLARCETKIEDLGFYATTDPFEFVAEYSTAVKLGYAKNDPDLDRMCKSLYAPVPKKAKAA